MFSAELFHRLCFDWSSFNESLLCLLLLLWWLIGNNWRMKFRYWQYWMEDWIHLHFLFANLDFSSAWKADFYQSAPHQRKEWQNSLLFMTNVQLWQPKSAQNEAGFSFVVSVWSPHQDQDQQHVNQTNPCPSFCISVILLCFYQHNTVTLQAASELLPPLLMITISNYVVCVCVRTFLQTDRVQQPGVQSSCTASDLWPHVQVCMCMHVYYVVHICSPLLSWVIPPATSPVTRTHKHNANIHADMWSERVCVCEVCVCLRVCFALGFIISSTSSFFPLYWAHTPPPLVMLASTVACFVRVCVCVCV